MKKAILGVDIGGVIINQSDPYFFTDNYLLASAIPNAFNALERLTKKRFDGDVFLISKCGERTRRRNLHWLEHHDFYSYTGIDKNHVHFCNERYEKSVLCKELNITHFIDDNLEVLSYILTPCTLYWFQQTNDVARKSLFSNHITTVNSWAEILMAELP
jgi:hypothetical protein